jgi:hypothetical protein
VEHHPRVQQQHVQQEKDTNPEPLTTQSPRVPIDTSPRVQFDLRANEEHPFEARDTPGLIVESPAPQQTKPQSILKKPQIVASDLIAARVASRR